MKTISIIFIALIAYNSNAQAKNYSTDKSLRGYAEYVSLSIEKVPVTHPSQTDAESAVIAAILPTVIEQGVKVYKDILSSNAKKYQAQYEAQSSEGGFWLNKNDIGLPLITVKRKLTSNSENLDASSIRLKPELSADGSAFRFLVEKVSLEISKAKTTKNNHFCDIKVDIKFTAIERTDNVYTKADKGTSSILIPAVQLAKPYNPNALYTGWFPILTNSGSTNPNGNYEISVTVTETNPVKIKKEKFVEFVENNSESLTSILKVIVESPEDKEEESEEGEEDKD